MRIIAGEAGGRRLKSIKGSSTRPTSDRIKESLFNILSPYLPVGQGLDLFAGFGGLGIEALSRGVARMTFVEKDVRNCKVLRENLAIAGFEKRGKLIRGDVFSFLKKTEDSFDLVLMDPPYQKDYVMEAMKLLLERDLLRKEGIIAVEHEGNLKLEQLRGFFLLKHKVYGDTALSVLKKGGEE